MQRNGAPSSPPYPPSFSPSPRRLLALKHFVTSPLAQSLRVKVSPRKREQSWNETSPSVPPPAHRLPLRSQPHRGSLRPAAGAGIQPPPSPTVLLHPGGSESEDRSPTAPARSKGGHFASCSSHCPGRRGWGTTRFHSGPAPAFPEHRLSPPQPSTEVMAGAGAGATPQVHQSSGRTREASARGE